MWVFAGGDRYGGGDRGGYGGGDSRSRQAWRQGDWECDRCRAHNFASRGSAGQTRHQKGVTAAETGVTVVEVVMATGVAEGMTGVTIGVVEGEGAEERLPSSLATGTAQTAAHIILQAVKPATSAMRPSEERPSCV